MDQFYAHPTTGDRRQPYCKDCTNARTRKRYAGLDDQRKDRIKRRAKAIKYGMTLDQFDAFVAERTSDLCDICGQPDTTHRTEKWARPLVIDHDPVTGRIRGWLCTPCNLGLGNFKNDPEALRRAIEYLQE